MADFRRLELATGYRTLGGVEPKAERGSIEDGGVRRRLLLLLLVFVACTTAVALSTVGFCLRKQRKLELKNDALKESFLVLESKMEAVLVELAKVRKETKVYSDRRTSDLLSIHRRTKRSNRNGEHKDKKGRDHPRAMHFQLDVEGNVMTQLKWKVGTAADTGAARPKKTEPRYLLNGSVRLSDDRTSVTIDEPGLYFIYAQIHFENPTRRNAFAVNVDNVPVVKCFQSLDFFNRSLSAAENSRLKPCYTAAPFVLRQNQVVSIVNLYPHRIFSDPFANFWGLVKLAD